MNDGRRHRRSIRLPGYDYTSNNAYFVTMVIKNRECLLEDPRYSEIVEWSWKQLATLNDHVVLDEYVVMPNHFHGILVIDVRRGGSRTAPTNAPAARKPLGRLIGSFKTMAAKRINLLRDAPGLEVWQRNYYERIIRDEAELGRIRQYVIDNPANWLADPENPVVAAVPRSS